MKDKYEQNLKSYCILLIVGNKTTPWALISPCGMLLTATISTHVLNNTWSLPSLNELTPIIFNMKLTHLGSVTYN